MCGGDGMMIIMVESVKSVESILSGDVVLVWVGRVCGGGIE